MRCQSDITRTLTDARSRRQSTRLAAIFQTRYGPASLRPLGDAPLGDAPSGDAPLGDAPFGDAPLGDAPLGDAPLGDEESTMATGDRTRDQATQAGAKRGTETSRRAVLGALAGGSAALVSSCSPVLRQAFLANKAAPVPVGTRSFVSRMFGSIDRTKVWDTHVHMIGNGQGGSGAYVNPAYRSELYKSFLYDFYMAQGGVSEDATADADSLKRLLKLHRLGNPAGKIVLLAFDVRVNEDGTEDLEGTEFGVPNSLIAKVAKENVDVKFGASVHPYRKDAIARLDKAKEDGAILVKWLPNAMGIDPGSPRCDAFYDALVKHNLVLLLHAGEEQAADSAESQALGNPLRLRRALDKGVKVIVAHCAGLGDGTDTDRGADAQAKNFDLFMRLFDDKQYASNLFADISAMTQINRSGRPLREMILATHLHPRLLNGSDYPLPALNPLVSTRWLERLGYLDEYARRQCNRVYDVNPLLFDFVVKRSLRVRDAMGRQNRFSDVVFETSRIFDA